MTSPEPSSHRRKRQRLSSPTYDEQIPLSQQEVAAFDTFEETLSQGSRNSSPFKASQSSSSLDRTRRDEIIASALGFKKLNTGVDMEDAFEESSGTTSPSLSSDRSGKKENRKPSSGDRAYSPSYSRTSPATSPRSPSKRQPRSPKKEAGSMPASSQGNPFATNSPPTSPSRKRVSGFTSALQAEHGSISPSPKGKNVMPRFASALSVKDALPLDDFPSSSPTAPPEKSEEELADWFQSSDIPSTVVSFTSAKNIAPVVDEDDWFKSDAVPTGFAGFQSAKSLKPTAISGTNGPAMDIDPEVMETADSTILPDKDKETELSMDAPPAFTGFTTGKTLLNPSIPAQDSWIAPSEAALKKAAAMMNQWEKEIDKETSHSAEGEPSQGLHIPSSQDFVVPPSPSPAGPAFKKPIGFGAASGSSDKKPFKSPLLATASSTPFRPPLLATPSKTIPAVSSPLNPKRNAPFATPIRAMPSTPITPSSVGSNAPLFPSTPMYFSSSPSTPRSLGMSSRKVSGSSAKKQFSTPFKPGMKPGEPGRALLEQQAKASTSASATQAPGSPVRIIESKSSAKQSTTRKNDVKVPLASSGLVPQSYTREQLESMGLNVNELCQVTPDTAAYYCFFGPTPLPLRTSQLMAKTMDLGSGAAFSELKRTGFPDVRRDWVDNHWALILWKLAGMAAMDPKRERDPETKRFCWDEAMRQLRARYEREIRGTSRPPLRLITTQDAPPSCPMVLCVTGIIWPEGEEGNGIPELEITDGWYRLKAQIDEPLARAIKKGTIKIGRKIAVTGCRLEVMGKGPADILDAYDSIMLKIYGNSSHLAPWHAKLGFQADPYVSSLRSLTPDGGMVAVIDVLVDRVYPIAFMEFVEDEQGNRITEGPRTEADEQVMFEQWKARRGMEADKLRAEFQKSMQKWEVWLERLGGESRIDLREPPPERLEDLMVELEDLPQNTSLLRNLSPMDSVWLAQLINAKLAKDRQNFYDSMERELDFVCPPRDTRNFRVVMVKDAQSVKYPATRTSQVTIWDVLSFQFDEASSPGHFAAGERFMMTNLLPTHKGSWGKHTEPESQIYLATRRDTRIRKLS